LILVLRGQKFFSQPTGPIGQPKVIDSSIAVVSIAGETYIQAWTLKQITKQSLIQYKIPNTLASYKLDASSMYETHIYLKDQSTVTSFYTPIPKQKPSPGPALLNSLPSPFRLVDSCDWADSSPRSQHGQTHDPLWGHSLGHTADFRPDHGCHEDSCSRRGRCRLRH
jgi:hypothetical protein